MAEAVFDASALLAFLLKENGGDNVRHQLQAGGITTAVISCEIATKLIDRHVAVQDISSIIEDLGLEIVPFTSEDALRSARLRHATRSAGLSLGDRACIALAAARELPVYTADRLWASLDLPVEIRLIR